MASRANRPEWLFVKLPDGRYESDFLDLINGAGAAAELRAYLEELEGLHSQDGLVTLASDVDCPDKPCIDLDCEHMVIYCGKKLDEHNEKERERPLSVEPLKNDVGLTNGKTVILGTGHTPDGYTVTKQGGLVKLKKRSILQRVRGRGS